ncbi:hypothetical protein TNCV_668461 [Trichonephila clavipes]|nr:hypothetical protein TNCV_668461 [Trichonephila clavipes]
MLYTVFILSKISDRAFLCIEASILKFKIYQKYLSSRGLGPQRVLRRSSLCIYYGRKSLTKILLNALKWQYIQEPRKVMGNSGHCRSNPEAPEESRGCCPLLSNHQYDVLRVYLHWLGLDADETCSLCGHARTDGDHLIQCT